MNIQVALQQPQPSYTAKERKSNASLLNSSALTPTSESHFSVSISSLSQSGKTIQRYHNGEALRQTSTSRTKNGRPAMKLTISLGILFDWEVNFYKPIMGDERCKLHKNELQSILLEDRWKLRLSRRNGAFFTFLENLVVEIEYVRA